VVRIKKKRLLAFLMQMGFFRTLSYQYFDLSALDPKSSLTEGGRTGPIFSSAVKR
jgi:hypothetical protein